jgi:hypothetical protein
MATLFERLANHDWYFEYSDDQRVWRRGRQKLKELRRDLEGIGCPYSLGEIRMTVHKMIFEDFALEDDGKYYRQPREKYVAGARAQDLITRAKADEVEAWLRRAG